MHYEEFSKEFNSSLERHDAWLTALIQKANVLGRSFGVLIEAPEEYESGGKRVPVVQVIEYSSDLSAMAPLSGSGLTVLRDGAVPFAVSVVFRKGSRRQHQFNFLAVRIRGGKAEYALWDAPNAYAEKEKNWMTSERDMLGVMVSELETYFRHDPALGKLNSSSVRQAWRLILAQATVSLSEWRSCRRSRCSTPAAA
jgi:hypothetical protein